MCISVRTWLQRLDFRRLPQITNGSVITHPKKAAGINQLSAVSATTVQFVPAFVRKMPPGLRRQSMNVAMVANRRPTTTPPSKIDRKKVLFRVVVL